MARRIEGTTLGGFVCDCEGCEAPAVFAAQLCIPARGLSIKRWRPLTIIFDTHVCVRHWTSLDPGHLLTRAAKTAIEDAMGARDKRPSYDRTFFRQLRCHSAEFLEFQRARGLVPADDAKAEGEVDMSFGVGSVH